MKKIKIKDDDQCALRDLYSLIIYDKFDDDNLMNRVVENAEAIENSSYETYYFIHKVSNDDKYLNMAKEELNEILKSHAKSSALAQYPIPKLILESN